MSLVTIQRSLSAELEPVRFGLPVTHVYDPLVYARRPHEEYLSRYGRPGCEAVLVGMNPGPWGMAQTGVPFGAVGAVRDWLGIDGPVGRPPLEHPDRPVLGFACRREEASGRRLWGWAAERFRTPAAFGRRFFVWNYCPLIFFDAAGRNITPDKLRAAERTGLFAACDRALRKVLEILAPRWVIGVGAFAESRAREAIEGLGLRVGRIPHPSPASPIANRGWAAQAEAAFRRIGIEV